MTDQREQQPVGEPVGSSTARPGYYAPAGRGAGRRLAALPLHPFLFAALFVVHLLAENLAERPDLGDALVVLAVVLVATAAVLAAIVAVLRSTLAGAAVTSLAAVVIFAWGDARRITADLGVEGWLAPAWLGGGVLAMVLLVLLRRRLIGMTEGMNFVAAFLVAVNLLPITSHLLAGATGPTYSPANLATFDGLPASPHAEKRDIYYIILDRYPSQRTLLDPFYGFDNSAFLDELERRGFYVAENSHANYTMTALSLASSLNMTHLDHPAMRRLAAGPGDWKPVYDMLQGSLAVPDFLKSQGYTYVQIPSWFSPIAGGADVDVLHRFHSLSEFADALYRSTSLAAILRRLGWDLVPDPHVANALYQFERVKDLDAIEGPKFVYVHILLPHPPYVFDRQGVLPPDERLPWRPQEPPGPFLEQLRYTNERVLEVLEALVSGDEARDPIVIIQADEGPVPTLVRDWRSGPSPGQYEHKFGILNAYYLPGRDDASLYPSITPANTFRVLFNSYFGTHFPLLPDRVYAFWDRDHIYDVADITHQFDLRSGR